VTLIGRLLSYFAPLPVAEYDSLVSGKVDVRWENGRLAMNGPHVNYSFNRLHKVMRKALLATSIKKRKDAQILNLGMGAGSAVEILREDLAINHPIVSVELDPVVIQIAKEHFDIARHADHEIVEGDAASFMAKTREKFDLIIVDVFVDDVVPEKFRQQEFIVLIHDALTPHGQAVFNHLKRAKDGGYTQLLHELGGSCRVIETDASENEVLLYSKR